MTQDWVLKWGYMDPLGWLLLTFSDTRAVICQGWHRVSSIISEAQLAECRLLALNPKP